MAGFLNIVIATSLICVVYSQLIFPDPALNRGVNDFEVFGPATSTVTIIDNPMALGIGNALQSMILSNILDSSIHMAPDSYGNIDFMVPCTVVVETVTYSPVIDTFFPAEGHPMFDVSPAPYSDVSPNIFLTEALPPKVFYTETVTSFAPSAISPLPLSSNPVGMPDIYASNLGLPVSCLNGLDVIALTSAPANSIGLLDLLLPPPGFGGFHDVYFSGVPLYFDDFYLN